MTEIPKISIEERMAVLAVSRARHLLQEIHDHGYTLAEECLEGCSEEELYDIFDTLLNGTQVVLAAGRKLRDQS